MNKPNTNVEFYQDLMVFLLALESAECADFFQAYRPDVVEAMRDLKPQIESRLEDAKTEPGFSA